MLSLFTKRRGGTPHAFVVAMSGVQMGDQLLQIGCSDAGRLAAIAGKVGLSGRAVAAVTSEQDGARVTRAAAQAGVLVEVVVAPLSHLALEDGSFDLAVLDNAGGLLAGLDDEARSAVVREALRVLRPGGRVMVVSPGTPQGLKALLGKRDAETPGFDPSPMLLAGGFAGARLLADKEGLVFVEALKPRK